MDIDQAIDDFIAAGARLGLPEPTPPVDRSALDQLEAEIAPLRLPTSVRRFWERVDPKTLRVILYPPAIDPEVALEMWQDYRQEFAAMAPAALLTIGVDSLSCMSVELGQDDVEGGAIFDWYMVDGGFTRKFNDLQGWFKFQEDALDSGNFDEIHRAEEDGRILSVPRDSDRSAFEQMVAPVHPLYGDQTLIERDIMEWPEHWRLLAGVTDESVRSRGATHSIAELLSTDPATAVAATLVAKVVSLAGSVEGDTVRVDDGTGLLVVHCPQKTTALGPALSDTFEFDVVVPEGERVAAVDPESVDGGPEAQFIAQYAQPIGAVATAVRRT